MLHIYLFSPVCIAYSSAESLLQSLYVVPEWDPDAEFRIE